MVKTELTSENRGGAVTPCRLSSREVIDDPGYDRAMTNRTNSAFRYVLLMVAIASSSFLAAQDGSLTPAIAWPQFRGPNGNGHAASAADIPLKWNEGEASKPEGRRNIRWKTPLPGTGWSTPVIGGGRIWMTSAEDDGKKLLGICVDAKSGRVLRSRVVFEVEKPEPKNRLNSFASPSPALDDEHVYLHFGSYGTACLDAKTGKTIWQRRDLNCDHQQGPGSSPVIIDDVLVFNVDGMDVQYVIALDLKTGKTRWKTKRSVRLDHLPEDRQKSYTTPIVITVAGKKHIVSTGAEGTMGYDPKDGKELWQVRHRGFSNTSLPVANANTMFLNTGFMRPSVVAIRFDGEKPVSDERMAWVYSRSVPKIPSSLVVDGLYYMVNDNGTVTCLDVESGERLWVHRIGGEHCSSPIYAGERLYFCDREGVTTVIAPGREYRELAQNRLEEGFMASPAVVDNALILRTTTHLYRIETTKTKKAR